MVAEAEGAGSSDHRALRGLLHEEKTCLVEFGRLPTLFFISKLPS